MNPLRGFSKYVGNSQDVDSPMWSERFGTCSALGGGQRPNSVSFFSRRGVDAAGTRSVQRKMSDTLGSGREAKPGFSCEEPLTAIRRLTTKGNRTPQSRATYSLFPIPAAGVNTRPGEDGPQLHSRAPNWKRRRPPLLRGVSTRRLPCWRLAGRLGRRLPPRCGWWTFP